jgi:hypothetical protein
VPPSDELDENADQALAPILRGRIYRERAAALEAELANTVLPNLRVKLRAAADRFLALAETSERLASSQPRSNLTTEGRELSIKLALAPFADLLSGGVRRV